MASSSLMWFREALRKLPAFASEISLSPWTEKAPTICRMLRFHMLSRNAGEKIHFEVMRGTMQMGFDITLKEHPHEMDQVSSLADPEKNLVPQLGILAVEIDKNIASMIEDLRDPYGIIVAARAAG